MKKKNAKNFIKIPSKNGDEIMGGCFFVPTGKMKISSESLAEVSRTLESLKIICEAGFKNFTIDGRWGIRELLERNFSEVPIQFCQFHQKKIIRKYNANHPKTACGRDMERVSEKIVSTKFEI